LKRLISSSADIFSGQDFRIHGQPV